MKTLLRKSFIVVLGFFLTALLVNSCEETRTTPGDVESLEGEWKVEETSENFKSAQATYQVYISPSQEDSTQIIISNFYHLGIDTEVIGAVNGNRIELLSNQTVTTLGVSYTVVSGTGIISDDYQNIDWQYVIDDGSGQTDNVTAIYTKL